MGKYSLLNVFSRENGRVSGVWLQDFTGSLYEALQLARDTEKANSNRIEIAVVERVGGSISDYSLKTNLEEIRQI
jgi:hypothetical protein